MRTTFMPVQLATYKWYAEHQAWLATTERDHHKFPIGTVPVRVYLDGAYLREADLREAYLSGANLSETNLSEANFSGANLDGANLYGASGIVSFGPVGATGRLGYAVRHNRSVKVQLGCFWGTAKTAIQRIRKKYGDGSAYEQLVVAACRAVQEQCQ